MKYRKKIINEEELIKNMLGGVEEATKNISQDGDGQKKKGLSPGLIILIVLILVIVIVIIVFVVLLEQAKKGEGPFAEKKRKFYEIRCDDIWVRNFPGTFGPEGMTVAENDAFCQAKVQSEVNKKQMGPMQDQLNNQNRMLEKQSQLSASHSKMFNHIRKNIEKQYKDIYQKLINLYKRLAYLFKKFARLFYQIFVVFKDIFMTLKYAIWTLTSMWEGPIGNTVRVLCFGGETLILVERNGRKIVSPLNKLELGDINDNNNMLIGVCQFLREDGNQFYSLNGVNVSGSHLIEYKGNNIRVKTHPDAIKVEYQSEYIYSVITETGRLKINSEYFRDHLGDNTLETYLNFVKPICDENFLENIDTERYKNSAINLYPGFTCKSSLKTNNGIKKAEDIILGELINGKKVLGIVKYRLEGKTFITNYNLDNEHQGMLVGIQFFKKNDKIYEQEERWILGKLDCIGLLVEGAMVDVNEEISVADFDIVSDEMREMAEEQIA